MCVCLFVCLFVRSFVCLFVCLFLFFVCETLDGVLVGQVQGESTLQLPKMLCIVRLSRWSVMFGDW